MLETVVENAARLCEALKMQRFDSLTANVCDLSAHYGSQTRPNESHRSATNPGTAAWTAEWS